MAMSEKKIGRMVTADVDKALANIGESTPKPDMKADDELKKAAGPSRDLTRGEAFRLARMKAKLAGEDPSKATFTWGGKTYNTRMAGEGAKATSKPTAPKDTPPKPADVSESTKRFVKNLPLKPKPETPAASKPKPKTQGDTYSSGVGGARSAAAQEARKSGKSPGLLDSAFGKWVHKTNVAFQERQKKKYGKAAGGSVRSIDGCAVRGKTRAMKKGK